MPTTKRVRLAVAAGTNPEPDSTSLDTMHFTDTDGVYFYNNRLHKDAGHESVNNDSGLSLIGGGRTLYSYISGGKDRVIIGTNLRLFVYQDGTFYNITPLIWTYTTLGTDPISVTNTTSTVTVTSTAHNLTVGETVILDNITATGGIAAADLNGTWEVASVPTSDTYTFTSTGTATSTATGGGSTVLEIKPTTTALGDTPLANDYTTLGIDPLTTVSGTAEITVNHTSHNLIEGDNISISGSTATNGIPAGDINTTHYITEVVDTDNYKIIVSSNATSSGTGGGSAIDVATGIVTVTATAHGMIDGDRVALYGCPADFGGTSATEVNAEHIIKNVQTNTFDIVLATVATSSATGGGSSVMTYQKQIPAGDKDYSLGFGWGGGLWQEANAGVLWNEPTQFTNTFSEPRIWAADRYGNDLMLSPCGGGFIYVWDGTLNNAPVPLNNAPQQNDWVAVIGDAVLSLYNNTITISDKGDATEWTAGADTNAYSDSIEGIDQFITTAISGSRVLLFTESSVLILDYVAKPDLYTVTDLTIADGILGKKARTSIDDLVFWVGQDNLYQFDGRVITQIARVSENGKRENTVLDYFYENLNFEQRSKVFIRTNIKRGEIRVYYPFQGNDEPTNYFIYNYVEGHFTLGTESRTAAEEPQSLFEQPYMLNCNSDSTGGTLYKHEIGVNADGSPLTWYAETNYQQIAEGDNTFYIDDIIPDAIQTGNVKVTIYTKNYPQDTTERTFGTYTISATKTKQNVAVHGRMRKIRFEQDSLDDNFSMGAYMETVRLGSRQ